MANLVTRAYNSWQLNETYGTLRKISADEKLRDEIDYYRSIPAKFKIFFPRMIDHGVDGAELWMDLEKYDYPNLGEYFTGVMDTPLHKYDWDCVLSLLKTILSEWSNYSNLTDAKFDDAYTMYVSKTSREYAKFREQNVWPGLFEHDTIVINGVEQSNFSRLWPKVQRYIIDVLLPSYTRTSFIHGDFCFANMLYGNLGTLRFVDPRGSFGRKGYFGDARYDVAKLYHSVDGNYEFLNNDLFVAEWLSAAPGTGPNNWKYSVESAKLPWVADVQSMFENHFFKGDSAFSKKDITLIEGLIFVGSCARHYENPNRQLALYLTGIERLNRALAL